MGKLTVQAWSSTWLTAVIVLIGCGSNTGGGGGADGSATGTGGTAGRADTAVSGPGGAELDVGGGDMAISKPDTGGAPDATTRVDVSAVDLIAFQPDIGGAPDTATRIDVTQGVDFAAFDIGMAPDVPLLMDDAAVDGPAVACSGGECSGGGATRFNVCVANDANGQLASCTEGFVLVGAAPASTQCATGSAPAPVCPTAALCGCGVNTLNGLGGTAECFYNLTSDACSAWPSLWLSKGSTLTGNGATDEVTWSSTPP
jgi:hypothetical protein